MPVMPPPIRDINPVEKDGTFSRIWQYFFNDQQTQSVLNEAHRDDTGNPHKTSDANLVFSDITTHDVSTSEHGFVPKAPGDTTEFLRGDGAWAITPGSVPATSVESETSYGITPAVGSDVKFARGGHTHGSPPHELPMGGSLDDVLAKTSGSDYAVGWVTPAVTHSIPVGGDAGQVLEKNTSTDYDVIWADLPTKTRYAPVSLTLVAGTNTAGNVASVVTAFDGNTYNLTEVAATPGFDVDFVFAAVVKFNRINIRVMYDGTASHRIQIKVYNYTAAAWEDVTVYSDTGGYFLWLTVEGDFPAANYVSAGAAKIKVYHVSAGNASHHIQIDYVSLVQDGDI